MKVYCRTCGRKVSDTFKAKWKHSAKFHPEKLVEKIIPMICNPDRAFQAGQKLADYFKGRMGVA